MAAAASDSLATGLSAFVADGKDCSDIVAVFAVR